MIISVLLFFPATKEQIDKKFKHVQGHIGEHIMIAGSLIQDAR